jgi:hypothetical protein
MGSTDFVRDCEHLLAQPAVGRRVVLALCHASAIWNPGIGNGGCRATSPTPSAKVAATRVASVAIRSLPAISDGTTKVRDRERDAAAVEPLIGDVAVHVHLEGQRVPSRHCARAVAFYAQSHLLVGHVVERHACGHVREVLRIEGSVGIGAQERQRVVRDLERDGSHARGIEHVSAGIGGGAVAGGCVAARTRTGGIQAAVTGWARSRLRVRTRASDGADRGRQRRRWDPASP